MYKFTMLQAENLENEKNGILYKAERILVTCNANK